MKPASQSHLPAEVEDEDMSGSEDGEESTVSTQAVPQPVFMQQLPARSPQAAAPEQTLLPLAPAMVPQLPPDSQLSAVSQQVTPRQVAVTNDQ